VFTRHLDRQRDIEMDRVIPIYISKTVLVGVQNTVEMHVYTDTCFGYC